MILICLYKHVKYVFKWYLSIILCPILSLLVFVRLSNMLKIDLLLFLTVCDLETSSFHFICDLIDRIFTKIRKLSENCILRSYSCSCLSCNCTVELIYWTYLCTTILHSVLSVMTLYSQKIFLFYSASTILSKN